MTVKQLLSIVIVNWNTKELLSSCLRSIEQTLADVPREVIVVDNASIDKSGDLVLREFPGATLISNLYNKGFAGGVNDGIRRSTGAFILVLNPDIVLQAGAIQQLLQHLQAHPDVGAMTPRLINKDGSIQYGYIRRFPTVAQVWYFQTILAPWSWSKQKLVHRHMEMSFGNLGGVIDVDQIPGACMLIRREVVDDVGLMDEDYLLFYEDVDWCYRMKQRKWRLCLHLDVSVLHIGGQSFVGGDDSWMFGRFVVSLLLFFDKQGRRTDSFAVKLLLLANSGLVILIRSVQLLVRPNNSDAAYSRRKHLYFLRLFFDTFLTSREITLHADR